MGRLEVVADPVRRQRYVFRRTAADTGGELVEVEVWVEPGGDVPDHVHPSQEEAFEVLAGDVTFRVDGRDRRAGPGDRLAVPPGVGHAFRNSGATEAHLRVEVRPALQIQEFLETVAGLGRSGRLTASGMPRRPGALLELALGAEHFRPVMHLSRPPLPVQRAFTAPLARLARRRGVTPEGLIARARGVP